MTDRRSFFAELKRRNVYKVAVAYAIVGWLIWASIAFNDVDTSYDYSY